MRLLILFLVLSFYLSHPALAIRGDDNTIKSQIIGDSVYLQDGSVCHVDNFENGKCIDNEWNFNFFNFWLGLLIPFLMLGYVAFYVKKKLKKGKTE